MIRYDLKCAGGHEFEAWFGSSSAFDDQAARGLVACALCGSIDVAKALMTPRVTARKSALTNAPAEPERPALSGPVPAEIAEKLAALRKEIEARSAWVGRAFAAEARAMHLGEAKARPIHGVATGEEARSLIEEGVPVAPLPFMPRRDD